MARHSSERERSKHRKHSHHSSKHYDYDYNDRERSRDRHHHKHSHSKSSRYREESVDTVKSNDLMETSTSSIPSTPDTVQTPTIQNVNEEIHPNIINNDSEKKDNTVDKKENETEKKDELNNNNDTKIDNEKIVKKEENDTNTPQNINTEDNKKKEDKAAIDDIIKQRRERMLQWKKRKQLSEGNLKKKEDEKEESKNQSQETSNSVIQLNAMNKDTPKTTSFSLNSNTKSKITFKPKIQMKPVKKGFTLKSKLNIKRPSTLSKRVNFLDDDDDENNESKPAMKKLKVLDDDNEEENKNDNKSMDLDPKKADEVDALDAFMKNVDEEVEEIKKQDKMLSRQSSQDNIELPINVDQGDNDYTTDEEEEEDILALAAKKLVKKKDLMVVDHSTIQYEPFRKCFYIEPPEMASMTHAEVEKIRMELDNIKVQGSKCPKPVRKWAQFGLPTGCLEVIKRVLKYQQPSPIQCQAIPAIMSGRDVISVAKTGSGKTIAFLLPMFRAIKDQRPIESQEGPIALIMTPTRELAVQIYRECKHFTRVLGLSVICAYGGSPIKDQIADLKRGAEIIVCTPGRMIDLLCANSGRVTNLRRVTYLVLDEADRMFDMGFEPQVMKIVKNIRPDRQTLLFSATFPKQIDALARKILTKPLEITVGGKSVVCEDVEQHVEVREEDSKFRRLLEILGLYYEKNPDLRTLVFVDRQEAADNLLRELIRFGYPCQSLHGGKDQADRDSTISDFKSGVTNILIATSVAARGLDVKDLNLVINYECPNHMEDYVHRVGRTGRAGNKGTAYTFVTPEQDRYANDIVNALKLSNNPVPEELQKLADDFMGKVKSGDAHYSSSGFGGKGLENLDKERDVVKKIQRKIHGVELGEEEEDNSDEEEEKTKETIEIKVNAVPLNNNNNNAATNNVVKPIVAIPVNNDVKPQGKEAEKIKAVQEIAALVSAKIGVSVSGKKPIDVVPEVKIPTEKPAVSEPANATDSASPYAYEIEINDYPQKARWRVTNKEQISMITELTGAAVTTRGTFYPNGKQPGPNERKLYLFIEGETQLVVDKAKNEIKRILTEATLSCIEAEARGTGSEATGRYTVV